MDHVPQRLSFVTLGTRDMRRARSFYEAWGWVERGGSTDEFASFDVGSTRLALYPLDLLGHEAAPGCSPPDSDWNGITLAINVESRILVDEVYAAATASGARAIAAPLEREWGGYSAYIADPEGQRWEIAWAP
jgi:uncharacterized protein